MNFGIKQKILLVLVGLLALTSTLDALLASYYTNQQNQESAFANLSRELQAWQDDLDTMTVRLRDVALATVGDTSVLNQLAELASLELDYEDAVAAGRSWGLARTAAYTKSISLSRLHLALRTGGFSSVAVYISGKLSHFVSINEAGMMVAQGSEKRVWLTASANVKGSLPFHDWPAWGEGRPQTGMALAMADLLQPNVSFRFPAPDVTSIEIVVPVQGTIVETLTDDKVQPTSRFISDLKIADTVAGRGSDRTGNPPATFAVVVFQKQIDRAFLQEIERKTGKSPILFSMDGSHRQQLANADLVPSNLLRQAQAIHAAAPSKLVHRTVTNKQGSFYEALLPWYFEGQPRLILSLVSSRDSTLQNIRQTVTAILTAAGLIFFVCIGAGIFWVRRIIDPIVALTTAVKKIGLRRQSMAGPEPASRVAAEELQSIAIRAPNEIGDLAAAFDAMIAELRHAFETLEQRVQERTAELHQQTLYLRTLIDTLPLWVWLKDPQNRYLAANQSHAKACGHTVEEMIGKSDLELCPPALAARYQADDVAVMAGRMRTKVEQSFTNATGTVWMEIYRAPVLDEDGTVLGTVGAAHNVSERKAAEEAREKALAEAVRLARQRSEFLAQMSHELRTPLNAILGYAQLLRRSTDLNERQAKGLATIQESGQHLLMLINDILDLARIEANKLELTPTAINLSTFLDLVADIIRVKAEEKNLVFSHWIAPGLPAAVRVDERRLRQVLLNLLGNAVKFTDYGEITLRVQRLSMDADRQAQPQTGEAVERIRFEVEDEGIGMDREQLTRIFQPFEQVSEGPRREGGTGLGLAISQQLIRLMGGNIQVWSESGKGSKFWFDLGLPVAESHVAASKIAPNMKGYDGRRRTILIVDDVTLNRAMLMDTLDSLGFDVAEAGDGQECLDEIEEVRPDLIIMDLMMPVMDGLEATRRIRRLPDFAQLPIMVVTASATYGDESKILAAGANAFILKPIEQEVLLKSIGELLGLTWLDEESAQGARQEQEESETELVDLPREEIEILHNLARRGNMQDIIAHADFLKDLNPQYAPFATQLRDLAQAYQSKAIVALIKRYRAMQDGLQN